MDEPVQFRTKADLVYERLREEILSGAVRPGERVPINRIARDVGVSDIPAREGVKRLAADGLVTFTAHKGAVVARSTASAAVQTRLPVRSGREYCFTSLSRLEARACSDYYFWSF